MAETSAKTLPKFHPLVVFLAGVMLGILGVYMWQYFTRASSTLPVGPALVDYAPIFVSPNPAYKVASGLDVWRVRIGTPITMAGYVNNFGLDTGQGSVNVKACVNETLTKCLIAPASPFSKTFSVAGPFAKNSPKFFNTADIAINWSFTLPASTANGTRVPLTWCTLTSDTNAANNCVTMTLVALTDVSGLTPSLPVLSSVDNYGKTSYSFHFLPPVQVLRQVVGEALATHVDGHRAVCTNNPSANDDPRNPTYCAPF